MTKESTEEKETSLIKDNDQSGKRETTRSLIATIYVCSFLFIILLCCAVGCFVGFTVDEHKDMIVTISGVLSGPLGFIVGYYFKASKE